LLTKLPIMKASALLIITLILLIGLANAQTGDQLEQAYKEQSTVKLKAFFDDWSRELRPATTEQRKKMNKTVQQAYAIFEAFYNPHDLANHGSTQWGNDIYTGYTYLVLQDGFKIFQKDKVYYTEEEATEYAIENIKKSASEKYRDQLINHAKNKSPIIMENYGPNSIHIWQDSLKVLLESVADFRPNIIQTIGIPLYLTPKYQKILDVFLGNSHSAFAEGGVMNTAQAKGESLKRQQFLLNFIKIYYGHWGGSWQYLTYPSIGALVCDKDMKYAKIIYGMIYESGEAILENRSGTWKLISMKRIWRE